MSVTCSKGAGRSGAHRVVTTAVGGWVGKCDAMLCANDVPALGSQAVKTSALRAGSGKNRAESPGYERTLRTG